MKEVEAKDKSEKQEAYNRKHYTFCDGLFPIRRANCEKGVVEHCWIGGRRFTMEMGHEIREDGKPVCTALIRDKGEIVAKCTVYRGKAISEHIAHSAFLSYVKNLSGTGKHRSRGGFLKQAAERDAKRAAK